MLKSHDGLIYNYAWGRDISIFKERAPIKSVETAVPLDLMLQTETAFCCITEFG